MKNIKQKFINAIDNWRLKLEVWEKNWYNYIINIQELVWARNFRDWYNIFIYDKNMCELAELQIDYNLDKINFKYL
jgi:hypothetical protein